MGRTLFVGILFLAGCATETVCHNIDDMHCVQRGGGGEAIATAAAATLAWTTAGGCRINGCGPGNLYCNPVTELCERIACGEGLPPCPEPYACDFEAGTCD